MSSKPKKSLPDIGADLIAESQARRDTALPKSTELFPYLLIASRTMSLREISDWLDKKHQFKLSPAAISRALANPNLHLGRLADFISARARYVALVAKTTPSELLHWPDNAPSRLDELIMDYSPPRCGDDADLLDEATELMVMWQGIPHEVRLLLEPLLKVETDHDPDADLYEKYAVNEDED